MRTLLILTKAEIVPHPLIGSYLLAATIIFINQLFYTSHMNIYSTYVLYDSIVRTSILQYQTYHVTEKPTFHT